MLTDITPRKHHENGCIEPASGTCPCGEIVWLYHGPDNLCDKCGRNYNCFGQEVTPMAECYDHDDY